MKTKIFLYYIHIFNRKKSIHHRKYTDRIIKHNIKNINSQIPFFPSTFGLFLVRSSAGENTGNLFLPFVRPDYEKEPSRLIGSSKRRGSFKAFEQICVPRFRDDFEVFPIFLLGLCLSQQICRNSIYILYWRAAPLVRVDDL